MHYNVTEKQLRYTMERFLKEESLEVYHRNKVEEIMVINSV